MLHLPTQPSRSRGRRSALLALLALLLAIAGLGVSAKPAGAVVPGDNGRIVYAGRCQRHHPRYKDEICVMTPSGELEPNGMRARPLTDNDAHDIEPVWSPDGRKIAFASDRRAADYDIYVMTADGSHVTDLTRDGADLSPAWSPDGKEIAFMSLRDHDFAIYVMHVDGSHLTRLTDGPGDQDPTWSPDGAKIAFTRVRDARAAIIVMNADGSHPIEITNSDVSGSNPAWSPDGTRIAFVGPNADNESDIYVMDADGSHPTRLTTAADANTTKVYYTRPSWSPDGTEILFERSEFDPISDVPIGIQAINVMNADGSNPRQLTKRFGEMPDWQAKP